MLPERKYPRDSAAWKTQESKCASFIKIPLHTLSLQAYVALPTSDLVNPISPSISKKTGSAHHDQYSSSDDKQRQMSLCGLSGMCNYCLCRHSIIANEKVTAPCSILSGKRAWTQAPWPGTQPTAGLLSFLTPASVHPTREVYYYMKDLTP